MSDYNDAIYESRLKRDWKLYKVYEGEVTAERRARQNSTEINIIMDMTIEKISEINEDTQFSKYDSNRMDIYINDLIDLREKSKYLISKIRRKQHNKDPYSYENVDTEISTMLEKAKEIKSNLSRLVNLD